MIIGAIYEEQGIACSFTIKSYTDIATYTHIATHHIATFIVHIWETRVFMVKGSKALETIFGIFGIR